MPFSYLICETWGRHWRKLFTSPSSMEQPLSSNSFFSVWIFSTSKSRDGFLSERSMDHNVGADWYKTVNNVGEIILPV